MRIIIPFIFLLFTACESGLETERVKIGKYLQSEYHVILIDSCEYLMFSSDTRTITHKGNCKNHD